MRVLLALLAGMLGLTAAMAFAASRPGSGEQQSHAQRTSERTSLVGPADPTQTVLGPPDEYEQLQALPRVHYRNSRALGLPYHRGRLRNGTLLPPEGEDYFTWDPILKQSPNRSWRRWGTDRLVRLLLRVLADYRTAHPDAPRVGVGDLSRPGGGGFGRRYGGVGHASHQNGLDVDVYYPRRDGLERRARTVVQVDRRLAQDLVDRFVRAGAQKVFVGPRTGLTGRRRVVSALIYHDDHLHVRIPNPDR